jgi:hypothetical protein
LAQANWYSALKRSAAAPKGVKAQGDFSAAPRDFRDGVYFVSANLQSIGMATWAVGARAFRTGGGLIVAIGKTARAVANLGVDIPSGTLAHWGISTTTNGFAASRACVK